MAEMHGQTVEVNLGLSEAGKGGYESLFTERQDDQTTYHDLILLLLGQ